MQKAEEKRKLQTKQLNRGILLEHYPILDNKIELQKKLDTLALAWNYKIGEANTDFKEKVDKFVEKYADRFDVNAFSPESRQMVIARFISGNIKIANEIVDKRAFKEYVILKSAQYKMAKL